MFEILKYEGTVIRPPSEAESLILQLTLGCTDNNCTFCPAYKDKPFRIRDIDEFEKEIIKASEHFSETKRIFLADGDAITVPQKHLLRVFESLNQHFPRLTRISLYGSAKSLKTKTISELIELKKLKLGVIYIGMETGDDEIYRSINKFGSPQQTVETIQKVKNAGIKTNVTVILGLGGKKHTVQHAVNTGRILSQAKPEQIAALTLMIVEGTPLYNMKKKGDFTELDTFEFIEELKTLIENMEDFPCLFFSNHASNYIPVNARFPKDKQGIIQQLSTVLAKKKSFSLKPEWLRRL